MGRPTDYSEETALDICERLTGGESINSMCNDTHMPHKASVFRWLAKHQEFSDMYARAKEHQADAMAEEMLSIADTKPESKEDVNHARLRVDTRKWLMAKSRPRKYGDKLDLAHSGGIAVTFTPVDDDI